MNFIPSESFLWSLPAILVLFVTSGCSIPTKNKGEEWRKVDLNTDSDAQIVYPEPPLHFPAKATMAKISGFVEAAFIVNKIGKAKDIVILKEEPEGFGFGNSTINFLMAQEFRPAVLNCSRVDQRLKRKFSFNFK